MGMCPGELRKLKYVGKRGCWAFLTWDINDN